MSLKPMLVPAVVVAVVLGLAASQAAARHEAPGSHDPPATGMGWRVAPVMALANGSLRVPTTTVARSAPSDSRRNARKAPVMILLLVAGALVGVLVGLRPGLLITFLLGVRPSRLRRRRGAEDPLPVAPAPVLAPRIPPASDAAPGDAPPPEPVPAPDAPPPLRLPIVRVQPATGTGAANRDAAVSHARHRALYEAEYAKHLDRLGALRQAIGAERTASAGRPPVGRSSSRRNDDGPPPARSQE